MNIVNKLTLAHLKENKGRSVVTTLGIIVSVAMITAVFVAIASFMNLFGEVELLTSGRNVAELSITSSEQYDKLLSDERLSEVGICTDNETSYKLENGKSDYLRAGEVLTGNETYLKQMITGDYEGEIPKADNEIAIEKALIEKNGLNWKIGDTVYIPMGYRYVLENGEEFQVNGGYENNEQFNMEGLGEYKITAILDENPATYGRYTILCGCEFNKNIISETNEVIAAINLKKINYNSLKVIKDIIEKCEISEYKIRSTYLETAFAFDSTTNPTFAQIFFMALIIIAIIIIASVVLIYNAFAMSINERITYLGMLASVGATKKQKRMSVYFESFILGIIGIPIGFFAGVLGIGITLKALGSRIIETGMVAGVNNTNLKMPIVVPAFAVIGIVLVSIFTIFVSSFIPSIKASKITPIDAIRQTKVVKIKAKSLRSSAIIRKIFGYEGELANKNMKRNGRKARVITASIAMSVILFLSCNYFCDMFTSSVDLESAMPYQVVTIVHMDKLENEMKAISQLDDIDNCYSVTYQYSYFDSNENFEITKKDYYTQSYKSSIEKGLTVYINYITDEDFNELCKSNDIDYTQYYEDEPMVLAMNSVTHKSGGAKIFSDKILNTKFEDLYGSVAVGGFIDYDKDNYICNLNPEGTVSMYMPLSSYFNYEKKLANENHAESDPESIVQADPIVQIGIETEKHAEVTEKLRELMSEDVLSSNYVNDMVESAEVMNTLAFVIQVLVYGFIALISLITVFNIINTISTGIAMREKEFAMLKSVGITPKGFNKMIMLESALYGFKAILFSLPISAALSYAMNTMMKVEAIPFKINFVLYLCVTLVVFIIIGATMLYSVHKLRNNSIVETLKKDIN